MPGSAFSIAGPNIILDTAVAESLRQFADILEKSDDFTADLSRLIKKTFRTHKRIIFNGNSYSDEWVSEAAHRGLSNLATTVQALPAFISPKSILLFELHHVFCEAEIHSRYEIIMEGYSKAIHIEALTMIDIVKGEIFPACVSYQNELANLLSLKNSCGGYNTDLEGHLLSEIAIRTSRLLEELTTLEHAISQVDSAAIDILVCAEFYRSQVFTCMSRLRVIVDELETLVAKKHWPLPSYAQLLHSII